MNSNILDKSNDMKQLREQIRKLDERLDSEMQVKMLVVLGKFHTESWFFVNVGDGRVSS